MSSLQHEHSDIATGSLAVLNFGTPIGLNQCEQNSKQNEKKWNSRETTNGQGNFRKFVFETLKNIYIFFLLWAPTKTGLFLSKSGISKGNITARGFLYHPIIEEVC